MTLEFPTSPTMPSSATPRPCSRNMPTPGASEIRAPIPIEDIVEKHLKLRVEFDDLHRLLDIPRSGLGLDPDIFGAIWLEERQDRDRRKPRSRGAARRRKDAIRFTLAHEGGGHWRLHRPLIRQTREQVHLDWGARRPSFAAQARPRSGWSGRRISMRLAC